MKKTYLLPRAYNLRTGQRVKMQDLTGARLQLHQQALADDKAQQFADSMTRRTGESWMAEVIRYEA